MAAALVGVALSAALLWWVLRGVDLAVVGRELATARPVPLAIGVVIATATFPLRAWRWRTLLRLPGNLPVGWGPAWHGVAIGFAANNLLPLRAGEVARAVATSRLAPAPFSTTVASIAVERIFDGLVVVALLALGLVASDIPADTRIGGVAIGRVASVVGAVMALALAVAVVVVRSPALLERTVGRVLPAGPARARALALASGLRDGLSSFASPARVGLVVLQSLVLWLVNAAAFYACFRAFGIGVDGWGALVLQGVLIFGIAVPSSPGYVGPFEAVIVAVLALYGVGSDRAFSYAIAYHASTFVPITLLGFLSLGRTSLSFGALQRASAS